MMDKDLELLARELPETPPASVADHVTPWRKSVIRVLTGLALTSVTLNFLYLNYILPFVGMVLLLLGFRSLRRENSWFRLCWMASIFRLAGQMFSLILNATIYHTLIPTAALTALSATGVSLQLIQMAALWLGLRRVRTKAGLVPGSGSALAMLIWYLLIIVLGLSGYNGLLAGLAMVICFFCIIRCLYKLFAELDEAGYAITPAPVRVNDVWLKGGITAILFAGLACGYLFLNSYPMAWSEVDIIQNGKADEISAELLELGFPAEVLADLTEEDILACEGATEVFSQITEHSIYGTRQVNERTDNALHVYNIIDFNDFRVTEIAVKLPTEQETWKLIQHFEWTVSPEFYGTESIFMWPTSHILDGLAWNIESQFSGQVLYDADGVTYASPFHKITMYGSERHELFYHYGTDLVDAAFSFPSDGERHRGYISYNAAELNDGYIIDSWFNYVHQTGWAQYPVITNAESKWSLRGNWSTVQDALQFNPSKLEAESSE